MRWLLLIGLIVGIVWGSEAGTQTPVIEVSCPDSVGCLGLLERAISTAPEGAVIQLSELSKGIYYEHPLVIDKSLTIQGITYPWNLIIAVDHGYFLTVRSPGHPITVTLDNLVIQNSLVNVGMSWSEEWTGTGTAIFLEGPAEGNPEDLELIISDSGIDASSFAIEMRGRAQLTIEGSELDANRGLMAEGGGKVILEDNRIWFKPDWAGMLFKDVEAWLKGNKIYNISHPSPAGGIMAFGGEYYFIENEIMDLVAIAVALGGKTNADFRGNRIEGNYIGIVLYLPSCVPSLEPEFIFEGRITGADNLFLYNDRDLCPEDYPWPPGFVREGSG